MPMRDDFGIFILTHGRPDNVKTWDFLQRAGYSGKVWLVVDDLDASWPSYVERFGADKVLQFSKLQVARDFDTGCNDGLKASVFYARNACWSLAQSVGVRYFLQLDDDYSGFAVRFKRDWSYRSTTVSTQLDALFDACLRFLQASGATTLCLAQGGDFLGGYSDGRSLCVARRKAMNTFFCDTERPFAFVGAINEDVSTYTSDGRRGALFLTTMLASITQAQSQSQAGGMSTLYLDGGTYLKTFHSVLYCPSAVKVGTMGDERTHAYRIHHRIDWRTCSPKIVREQVRKPRARC
jgi:hypothetical protein